MSVYQLTINIEDEGNEATANGIADGTTPVDPGTPVAHVEVKIDLDTPLERDAVRRALRRIEDRLLELPWPPAQP